MRQVSPTIGGLWHAGLLQLANLPFEAADRLSMPDRPAGRRDAASVESLGDLGEGGGTRRADVTHDGGKIGGSGPRGGTSGFRAPLSADGGMLGDAARAVAKDNAPSTGGGERDSGPLRDGAGFLSGRPTP